MHDIIIEFFNDKFTQQEEEFISKIVKAFDCFENSTFFHSQILEAEKSKDDGEVGKLIESTFKYEFFKQNPDYDKNLSSEPFLKFFLPKTDLKYHDNNLQIKTATFSQFFNNQPINFISEKIDSNQEEYKSFFERRTTLTLFFIYEIDKKNNSFNFQFFFLTKSKLMNIFLKKPEKSEKISLYHYTTIIINFLTPTTDKLKEMIHKDKKIIKIPINNTKKHIYQNELKTNLNLKYLKTIQEILENNNFQNDFFEKNKYSSDTIHSGENGYLIETLLAKYLHENKNIKKLLLNQSDIKNITDIPVDFIIDNNFFQLKTIDLDQKDKILNFKLFPVNFFENDSLEEKINIYNSKVCNTLILAYSKKNEEIISYFLTYDNLLIKNLNQCKKQKKSKKKTIKLNCNILPGITCYYSKNQKIFINMSKDTEIIKQYSLSNQIEKLNSNS
ncbi:hypothetical protein [Candidatus Phytoplasma sp. AldY-WA1]|uniref:hypothetical protein n=1 Tax=Candidatus Phytoplasma sp. AldY-WA1 TaxID=2852100 RepID=UPI00254C629E|nr:hypothetical protein [Candidatus Phytoplasma sp. AldY-WA1]